MATFQPVEIELAAATRRKPFKRLRAGRTPPHAELGIELVSADITSGGPALTTYNSLIGKVAPVVYDANDDGKVGLADFASFISNCGKQPGELYEDAYRFD